ncbi:ABC-2 type transport system permease protein [Kitasatospora sp. GAS204A]|uniref:ABC transporter permease n=1 Tax=unclassified Kitasatospora TaxID=2633591 RepID=UPI0024743699|nr:ABC transporter permease [Kitasatospora sp. GAS204B]MDH6119494.1 ABC-2 type transport system permease protein [Kitasatospora sp. GAS204B]
MTNQSDFPALTDGAAADAAPGAAPDGVIHNIGYRGYQGPRLGRGYATRSLFVQGLRGAFGLGRSGRSKVLPMLMLAAITLPAALVVTIAIKGGEAQLSTDYPQYLASVGLLFAEIFVAAQAPVLLSRDLRYATVPLYFSRPIVRADYVRAKAAALVAAMLIVTGLPLLVLYLGALLGGMDFAHNTEHFGMGLLAALLYSVVFSAVALVIAAATPRRGFGVAAIMGVLVVTGIVATIIAGLSAGGLRNDGANGATWAYLISPSSVVDRFVNQVCGLASDSPGTPGMLGAAVFGLEIVALVVGAYLVLLRRYRKI